MFMYLIQPRLINIKWTVAAMAAVCVAYASGNTYAACGNEGQRACCVTEQIPSCNGDLVETGSCQEELDGNCGPLDCSIGVCRAPDVEEPDCGEAFERACCIGEGDACTGNTREVFAPACGVDSAPGCGGCAISWCAEITPCGGDGQRACCLGEGDTCDPGLTEQGNCADELGLEACGGCSIGVCRAITPCGGEGERACCFLEDTSIGACEDGLIEQDGCTGNCTCEGGVFSSSTTCVAPDCGGSGQRACCLSERIPSCDDGLVEDLSPGCAAVLGASNCGCGVGLGDSLGVCVAKLAVGQTGCDVANPCQDGAVCLFVDYDEQNGFESMCVPDQSDGLFGDEVCAAFYNPVVHAAAIELGITQTYGIGGSISFATTGSIEAGVAYAADGCYGCYYTTCYGFETDVSISGAACTGQIFDGLWGSVEGDSCAASVGVSFPGTKFGASASVGWAGQGLQECFETVDAAVPEATGQCFSVGLGLNPSPVGGSVVLCNTVTNLVACYDDSVSGDGDLILAPDQAPVALQGQEFVLCPGSSIMLPPLVIDPDGDPLTYGWTTDCPGGSFDDASSASPLLSLNAQCGDPDCTVSLTADGVDADGNDVSVMASATITTDPNGPIFDDIPDDDTFECGDDISVATLGSATASDFCGSVSVSPSDSLAATCGNAGTLTRAWTAADGCGNENTQDQILTIEDTTAPSIDTSASSSTMECDGAGNTADVNAWLNSQGGAAGSDVCGNVTWSDDYSGLSNGCGGTGSAMVTFTATDECGLTATTSATFTVGDTTAPTFDSCPTAVYHESPAGTCSDQVSYSVTASDACGTVTVVCVADDAAATGVSTTGGNFPVGTTGVTCTSTDDCGLSSVCAFDVEVNDPPQIISITNATQGVQFSDKIVPVVVTATDCGPGTDLTLELDAADVPNGLALSSTADNCAPNASGKVECTWTLSNNDRVLEPQGTYIIDNIKAVDPTPLDGVTLKSSPAETITLNVAAENATIDFLDTNPVAVQVATDGGNSGAFTLSVDIQELFPEIATAGGEMPGDIGEAVLSMTLVPVGPGSPSVVGTCTPDNDPSAFDYNGVLMVTCAFDDVEVNTYTAEATLVANASSDLYYAGYSEDVLVIFDPSLGFTTGGGHFYWPGTGERTNWGYTMKYNNSLTKPKGSLLLIRHLPDGTKYRIKSNALHGLAIGDDVGMGWASFTGKCTYLDPSMLEPVGNHEFIVYVEDHGEPGGNDRFWLQTLDKDNLVIPDLSMDESAPANAVTIDGGNIVVPH